MVKHIRNKELENYLTGKRVVVVGPAPYLEGTNLGETINKYDVICRLNQIIPKGLEKDYGNRTDIAFLNCATMAIGEYLFKMRESADVAEKIKYIVCPVLKAQHDLGGSVIENAKIINIFNTPFIHIGEENYNNIAREVGVEPNNGTVTMTLLLQYLIKELFITGISFYHIGNRSGGYHDIAYHKGYVPDYLKEKEFNPWVGHQQGPQMEYFKNKLLTEYGNIIKIDTYLQSILGIQHSNVEILK